jgi:hypothetical protein
MSTQAVPLRRWYNCWLVHAFGQWEPVPIQVRDHYYNLSGTQSEWGEWRDAQGQRRCCAVCGFSQISRVKG